ncbi:hypothetical protein ANS015_16090 [Paraclostridium bifermentans]|nr:hypothetical protein ANS015_16090 [Paraclostridium bifermentans]
MGIDIETLESCKGLNTAKEISQQARVWREAASNLYDNRGDIKKFIEDVTSKKKLQNYINRRWNICICRRNL